MLLGLAILAAAVIRRRQFLVGGVLGAFGVLVVLFPTGCGNTDKGFPPGGPDPNAAACSTLAVHQLGSIEQGPPSTDREFTSADFLQRRMALRAVTAASIFVLAGGAAELLTRRRLNE